MPRYKYKVISATGEPITGIIAADSIEAAQRLLAVKRLQVVEIKRDWKSISLVPERVKTQELIAFARQFSTLMRSGISLTRALVILRDQAESQTMRQIIQQIIVSVESGNSLTSALEAHPKTFPRIFINMVHAGEASGKLDEVFREIAGYLERSEEINSRIKSALVYPIIVSVVALIALAILYNFVIPQFEILFEDLPELNLLTAINIKISHFVRSNQALILIGFAAIIMGIRALLKAALTRRVIDRWGLHLPILGNAIRKTAIARIARTLSTLISSGVSLLDAMTLTAETAGNVIIKESIEDARKSVSQGSSLYRPLQESGQFPPMVTGLIRIGEETGDLENMLKIIADDYEKEAHRTIDAAVELIKPLLMLVLGCIVAIVLLSIYLPIISAMGYLGGAGSGL